MCSLLLVFSTLWSQGLGTQQETGISNSNSQERYFCEPGIARKSRTRGAEVFYTISSGGIVQESGTETTNTLAQMQSYEHYGAKLYIPLLLRNDFKVLLGYSYQPERFRYGRVSPELQPLIYNFQNKNLKSNGYTLLITKSLDRDHYMAFRAKVAFNGDYAQWMNFEQRYRTMNAFGLYGFKKNEDFEWGVGLYFSKNMRSWLLLPFAFMHKNFNEKWGIELAPPAYVYGRYNMNKKSILLFGGEFNSRMYSIDSEHQTSIGQQQIEYTMNHAEVDAMVSLEHQLMPWVWFSMKGGYQIWLPGRFRAENAPLPSLPVHLPDAPFFQVSLFLSPPDRVK